MTQPITGYSTYTDELISKFIGMVPVPPVPYVLATVTSATVNPDSTRSILVAYQGAVDIPTQWSSAFDVVIQTVGLSALQGRRVLLLPLVAPPMISDLIVTG